MVGVRRSPEHAGVQRWCATSIAFIATNPPLHQIDFAAEGFEWLDVDDADISVIAFLRKAESGESPPLLVVCNFTPVPRQNFLLGVPNRGLWREILNTRCARIRRCRLGQSRRSGIRARRRPWPPRVDQPHPAAALDDHAALGRPWLKRAPDNRQSRCHGAAHAGGTAGGGQRPDAAAGTRGRQNTRRDRRSTPAGRWRTISGQAHCRRAGARRSTLLHRRP